MSKMNPKCVKCGKRINSCPSYASFWEIERSSALIYSALYAGIA
jgi:L-lactate utilization protein LutB